MSSFTTFCGVRKSLAVREFLAIVHDVDAEANFVREIRERKSHMSRADHVQLGRWFNRLDVHAHLAPADEARLLREIVVELVVHELRPSIEDGFTRLPEGVVLVTTAANRSNEPSIAKHQHLRADALRRRTGRRDDGDECRRLTAFERFGDRRKDFLIHL